MLRRFVRRFPVALLVLFGCGTGNQSVQLIPPEITVLPLELPVDRPARASSFSAQVRVEVQNRSSESLVLERIEISTAGVGPFTIAPTIRSFNFTIPPARKARAELWVQVTTEELPGGSEGTIFLRGVAYFHASGSGFRRVFMQRMNVRPGRQPG